MRQDVLHVLSLRHPFVGCRSPVQVSGPRCTPWLKHDAARASAESHVLLYNQAHRTAAETPSPVAQTKHSCLSSSLVLADAAFVMNHDIHLT
jgi:hypothetical protein